MAHDDEQAGATTIEASDEMAAAPSTIVGIGVCSASLPSLIELISVFLGKDLRVRNFAPPPPTLSTCSRLTSAGRSTTSSRAFTIPSSPPMCAAC